MNEKIEPRKGTDTPAIAVFAVLALFLFWRARYGYCYEDEPFLLTLAQRLYKGDVLIVDEWHGCQNFGLLLLPLYAVYRVLFGSNDGILLCFRYAYCIVWLAALIVLYLKLRGTSRRGALTACVYMGLFSPLDYMTLSYTSVSLMCIMLIAAIVYCDVLTQNKSPLKTGLVLGALTTVSTLCYPLFAAVFVLWLIVALAVYILNRRRGKTESNTYLLRLTLAMLAVCAVCAAAYCVWLVSNAPIERIAMNLPMIFSDPQHKSRGFLESIISLIAREVQVGRLFYGTMTLLTLTAVVFRRKRAKIRIWLFAAALPVWVYCQLPMLAQPHEYLNIQMKGIAFVGALAFALLDEKPWKLFLSFYGLSMVYTVAAYMSSNTGLTVTAMCLSVAGIAAVMIIIKLGAELYKQYNSKKYISTAAVFITAAFVVLQLGLETTVRLRYTYYDDTLSALTEEIKAGSAMGLRTTPQNAEKYDEMYNSFNMLLPENEREGKTLLAYGGTPWVYLEADMEYNTLSAWLMGDPQIYARLEKYYEINGREYPDYIFIDYIPSNVPDGYEMTVKDTTAILKKQTEKNGKP